MDFDECWNIGITYTHMKNFTAAYPLLIKALELSTDDPRNSDDITLAKIHDSLGSCLQHSAEEGKYFDDKKVDERAAEILKLKQQA